MMRKRRRCFSLGRIKRRRLKSIKRKKGFLRRQLRVRILLSLSRDLTRLRLNHLIMLELVVYIDFYCWIFEFLSSYF
jgi:hypothetical protein